MLPPFSGLRERLCEPSAHRLPLRVHQPRKRQHHLAPRPVHPLDPRLTRSLVPESQLREPLTLGTHLRRQPYPGERQTVLKELPQVVPDRCKPHVPRLAELDTYGQHRPVHQPLSVDRLVAPPLLTPKPTLLVEQRLPHTAHPGGLRLRAPLVEALPRLHLLRKPPLREVTAVPQPHLRLVWHPQQKVLLLRKRVRLKPLDARCKVAVPLWVAQHLQALPHLVELPRWATRLERLLRKIKPALLREQQVPLHAL